VSTYQDAKVTSQDEVTMDLTCKMPPVFSPSAMYAYRAIVPLLCPVLAGFSKRKKEDDNHVMFQCKRIHEKQIIAQRGSRGSCSQFSFTKIKIKEI
jgi:hypothetical protein